jgi:hypothetical protein
VREASHPGACADAVAAALAVDADERQRLLETLCPEERVARTIVVVSRLLCTLVPCSDRLN